MSVKGWLGRLSPAQQWLIGLIVAALIAIGVGIIPVFVDAKDYHDSLIRLGELQNQVKVLEYDLQEKRTELSAKNKRITSLQNDIEAFEGKLLRLEAQVHNIPPTIPRFVCATPTTCQTVHSPNPRLPPIRQELSQGRESLEQTKDQFFERAQDAADLLDDVKRTEEEIKNTAAEIDKVNKAVKAVNKIVKAVSKMVF